MNTPPSRLVVVAQVAGAFGVRGEARVRSFTDDPEACLRYGPLRDAAGVVVLTPVSWRPQKDVWAVKTAETRQREDWEAMRGQLLHVPRDQLPPPDEDEFYIEDLVGCDVVHVDGRLIGRVKAVHNFGADDLVEVSRPDAPTAFLPFTRDMVPDIDLAARRIVVTADADALSAGGPPEGDVG